MYKHIKAIRMFSKQSKMHNRIIHHFFPDFLIPAPPIDKNRKVLSVHGTKLLADQYSKSAKLYKDK